MITKTTDQAEELAVELETQRVNERRSRAAEVAQWIASRLRDPIPVEELVELLEANPSATISDLGELVARVEARRGEGLGAGRKA